MKNIGILAIASLVALVLGVSSFASQTAHADVDGSVVIGCEFLIGAIDGDADDDAVAGDSALACSGNLTPADVANLAAALGDEDDSLEASDFDDIDLDANQIEEGPVTGIRNSTYVFAFVDDEGPVTFDADAGVEVAIAGVVEADELCDADAQDADCAAGGVAGDGVVVAYVTVTTADSEDEVDVTLIQDGDDDTTETILVTGTPNEVTLTLVEDVISESDGSTALTACQGLEVDDSDALSNPDSTVAIASVEDNDGVALTRVDVTLTIDDDDVATIGDDTGISVDGGTSGVAYFAVICGDDIGETDITAAIDIGGSNEDESTQLLTVVGQPASVALAASPAIIACDGTATSTVTATVTDSEGNNVANGTNVNFSVVALGTANPINTTTTDGVASSVITPLSGATAGVTVLVTAGDAQASIRVDCALPIPPTPGGPVATPTRTGTIGGPDTGNGGYIGQDSSAGFPAWTLVALALGTVALVAGGMVTRRVGK